MSTTHSHLTPQPAHTGNGPTTKQLVWVIVGALLLVGLFASGSSKSSGGTSSYTATTRSAWCQTHADDQWSGQMDDTTRRYFAECTGS